MSRAVYIDSVQVCGVSLYDLELQKEELEFEIKDLEMKMVALAAGPRDPVADSEGNPIQWHEYVPHEVRQLLTDYTNAIVKLNYINTALENPEDISDDTADNGKQEKARLIRIRNAKCNIVDVFATPTPPKATPPIVRDDDEGNSHG